MHLYTFSLCLGSAGLIAMAAGGLYAQSHGSDHTDDVTLLAHLAGRGGRSGRGGHGAAHTGQGHVHAPVGPRGSATGRAGGRTSRTGGAWFWSLLSPRVAFSVLVGFGATGLLAHRHLPPAAVALLALAGGIAFERLLVGPFWDFLLRFASRPALTLESAVMDRATAVMDFDANGQGLVAIELDGQVVQVLATLRPEDRTTGLRVRAGQPVRVEEVDAARNQCTVSRMGG